MTSTETADRMIGIGASASKLGCCQATVRRLIARGELRAQKVGAHWRISPYDLANYLARTSTDELTKEIADAAPPPPPELIARLSSLFDYRPTGD